jgi:hypothetical protein
VTIPRTTWVSTSGSAKAHPPVLNAVPIAAFMNKPSAIAVRTASWVWRRVMSKKVASKLVWIHTVNTAHSSTRVWAAPRQERSSSRCCDS